MSREEILQRLRNEDPFEMLNVSPTITCLPTYLHEEADDIGYTCLNGVEDWDEYDSLQKVIDHFEAEEYEFL